MNLELLWLLADQATEPEDEPSGVKSGCVTLFHHDYGALHTAGSIFKII